MVLRLPHFSGKSRYLAFNRDPNTLAAIMLHRNPYKIPAAVTCNHWIRFPSFDVAFVDKFQLIMFIKKSHMLPISLFLLYLECVLTISFT